MDSPTSDANATVVCTRSRSPCESPTTCETVLVPVEAKRVLYLALYKWFMYIYIYIGLAQTHEQAEQIPGPPFSVTAPPSRAQLEPDAEKEAEAKKQQEQQEAVPQLRPGALPASSPPPWTLKKEEEEMKEAKEEQKQPEADPQRPPTPPPSSIPPGAPPSSSEEMPQELPSVPRFSPVIPGTTLDREDVRSLASRMGVSRREMERLLGIHRSR